MQTICLDISNKGIIPTINAKQNDVGRKFLALLFENGIPYNASDNGVSFLLWYSGESGDGNYDTILTKVGQDYEERHAFLINENSVVVELSTNMLTKAGSGKMCLTMNGSDGETIGLWNIPYNVEEVPGYPSEESKPYYPKFVQSVNGVVPDKNGNVELDAGATGTQGPQGERGLSIFRANVSGYSSIVTTTLSNLTIPNGYEPKHGDLVVMTDGKLYSVDSVSGENVTLYMTNTSILGPRGYDGKTPVKGVDYFTSADVKEVAEQAAAMVGAPGDSVIRYDKQSPTAEQQAQARSNIGIVDEGVTTTANLISNDFSNWNIGNYNNNGGNTYCHSERFTLEKDLNYIYQKADESIDNANEAIFHFAADGTRLGYQNVTNNKSGRTVKILSTDATYADYSYSILQLESTTTDMDWQSYFDSNQQIMIAPGTSKNTFVDKYLYEFNGHIRKEWLNDELYGAIFPANDTLLDFGTNESVDVSVTGDFYLRVDTIRTNSISVYGVRDGAEVQLPLTNIHTRNSCLFAVFADTYKVETHGFETIRIKRTSANFAVVAYITQKKVQYTCTEFEQKRNFVITDTDATVHTKSGLAIWGIRKGKLLATRTGQNDDGSYINGADVYEIDMATNSYTKIGNIYPYGGQPLKQAVILDNDDVIVMRGDGIVIKSSNMTTWTQVFDLESCAYTYGSLKQLDAYKNMVILSHYKLPADYADQNDATNRKVYLSTDYGDTFVEIFDLAERVNDFTEAHIHAISFDRWEDMIWVVCGDGDDRKSIWYTKDFGANWYHATDWSKDNCQMTSIMPLKDCVLFGSDCPQVGVMRYNRPKTGTIPGVQMHFDFPFAICPQWNGTIPVASIPYIDYDRSIAFFGFTQSQLSIDSASGQQYLGHGNVFATDGNNFKEVYKSDAVETPGVVSVYGNDEKIYAKIGQTEKYVEMSADIFK